MIMAMDPHFFIFISCLTSYTLAQAIKQIVGKKEDMSFKSFFTKRGGILSSHSAAMISALTSVYIVEKVSTSFLVILLFSLIVYSDRISLDEKDGKRIHSFKELFIGGILGMIITLIYYFIYLV